MKNQFKVSNIAYFVYCNGKQDAELFNARLDFDISLIPYDGDDQWVEKAIMNVYQCLQSDTIPPYSELPFVLILRLNSELKAALSTHYRSS